MAPDTTLRVLMIEDNPGDARLVMATLHENTAPAFAIHHVAALAPGLDAATTQSWDVVLLDLTLPDSAGLDTVTRFLAQATEPPVVVLTGLDDSAVGLQAVQQGAQDYLVKGQGDAEMLRRSLLYAMERKKAQRTIRDLHARNQLILESLGEGVVGVDTHGTITFVNPAFSEMLGWAADSVVGQGVHATLFHSHADGDARAWDTAPVRQTLEDGERRLIGDEVLWHHEGHAVPVELVITAQRRDDTVTGAVVAIRDVTDREAAFDTLKYQLGFQQQLIDALPTALIYCDPEGMVLGCNRAFETLTGQARLTLIGRAAGEVLPASLAERLEDPEALTGETPRIAPARVTEGGEERRLKTVPVIHPDGRPGGIMAVVLD